MADQMKSLRAAKRDLRRLMRQKLPPLAAQETLVALPEYQAAQRISIYISMPEGELSTRSLILDALKHGKEIVVPYIYSVSVPELGAPASVMDMVSLLSAEDFEKLEPDAWGIPTPTKASLVKRKRCLGEQDPEADSAQRNGGGFKGVDVVVMPGMAFDRSLARLGHGKGYYDFFLARYQQLLERSSGPTSKMPFLGMRDEASNFSTGRR
ncbi:MAG: hypothetical protein Q9220_005895 [cf. Caloplaca sp. 1 TL-2023]